jgi:hypothetical protein
MGIENLAFRPYPRFCHDPNMKMSRLPVGSSSLRGIRGDDNTREKSAHLQLIYVREVPLGTEVLLRRWDRAVHAGSAVQPCKHGALQRREANLWAIRTVKKGT